MTKFMISFQIAFLSLHTNFQKLCQLFSSYFLNLIFMTIVFYQFNFFCHWNKKSTFLRQKSRNFSASFFFCLDQIFFKSKWTLKNWLKSHRFDVQSSILLKAFCHALLSFYTWKKKYLTMWFWTLNLRSRILGYQVKKKLLIE